MAPKRARIEERLQLAAFGNIFEFATVKPDGSHPVIDWNKVAASPYSAIISGFKFDKETGKPTDFERDNALRALAQLRDMHDFKAPAKTEHSGPGAGPIEVNDFTLAERARALQVLIAHIATTSQNKGDDG
jgi:hypothetical protein